MDIFTLETDGSYNADLDVCGIGGTLYKNGEIIDYYALTSKVESTQHETLSLLYGMLLAQKHGAKHLVIKTDSRPHADFFNNEKVLTHAYNKKSLIIKSLEVLKNFESFKFVFHHREHNRMADCLSTLYRSNGLCSSTKPIDVSSVLPQDTFLDNKYQSHNCSNQKHKKNVVLMFNICHNTNDKKDQYDEVFLNTLEYNYTTRQFKMFSQALPNDIESIIEAMHKQSLEHTNYSLIFNGEYSEMIRMAFATCMHMGKLPRVAFLALAPYWKNLVAGEAIDLFEGYNHKGKIFSSTQNVSIPEPVKNPNQKEAHYLGIQIRARKDTEKDKNGELIHTHYLIYESCDINTLTEEKTYLKKRLRHNLEDVIAELKTNLSQPEKYYQFDIQGVYAPVIHTYFTTGQSSNSTRHVLKKLDTLRAEAHFEQDKKWNKITNSIIAREASKAILLNQQKKKQKKSKIALTDERISTESLEAQSNVEGTIAEKTKKLSVQANIQKIREESKNYNMYKALVPQRNIK